MKKKLVSDIISSLYILLFLYTGLYKLSDQEGFRVAVHDSPLLKNYDRLIAITIPILELLIGLALLIPLFRYAPGLRIWGLRTGAALMAVFALYVGLMLRFSSALPCSCGGIIQKMNWHQHFYFNTLFTCLGLLAIWLDRKNSRQDQNMPALI